jgi:hypothetical protein
MNEHLETSLDEKLLKVQGLTWLPWIGKDFKNNAKRLLIVGESHYTKGDSDEEFQEKFNAATGNNEFTRECIYEAAVCGDWSNKTYDNIHRVLVRSNAFDKEVFWEQVVFYNFIPRLLDYREQERPTHVDFYNAWNPFIEVLKILQPTDCIFIGVSAANTFNSAMHELKITHEPIKYLESIGSAYARTAKLNLEKKDIKLSFIQHASKMFSWNDWNVFLERENSDVLKFLKNRINGVSEIKVDVNEGNQLQGNFIQVPTHLKHKPIIACDYAAFTNEEDDAKFLSIGRAQYDEDAASVKILRHTGERWSRQSEELPISRVADLALFMLSALKRAYEPNSSKSILNEVIIKDDELSFLRNEFENNKERINDSLLELRKILNQFEFEKL